VPIDYHPGAATDEWSGDYGVGSQYFAAMRRPADARGRHRLAARHGSARSAETGAVPDGRGRAARERIYQTIGTYLGYVTLRFDLQHVLVLGRVTSGPGGDDIVRGARGARGRVPGSGDAIAFHVPTEHEKRHGQAIAAASLPALVR
jgi:hypothetical protein